MLRTTRTLTLLGAACFAIGVGIGYGALSQTGGGPAEVPPASFAANEYVDSQGCVFIRAGIGGTVTWVPRVSRDRQSVCGQSPSLKPAAQTASATTAAESPVPPRRRPEEVAPVQTAPAPAPLPHTGTVPKPARSTARAPVRTYRTVQAAPPPGPGRIDLPPGPPKGYRNVFTDGRLNPHRGKGTAAGREQMRRIWTDDVPARLVTEQSASTTRSTAPSVPAPRGQTTVTVHVSSKAARRATSNGRLRYVQVGAFASPSNVRAAIHRLQRAGLPVSTTTSKGRKVILAGPFTTPAHTTRALAVVRRVGFADAFTR